MKNDNGNGKIANGDSLENLSREDLITLVKELSKRRKFGLVWEDKPEQVADDCEKKLPVLTEVIERHIPRRRKDGTLIADDGSNLPTHFIIEGDNYHALSVLNYTHGGKVDVIYIDPPYNTGNKDFIYNDRYVDKEDGYRHSKWLSFMEKRLVLAKNLLSDSGVIFISIDDNEQANLKLLCDEIFGEDNFVNGITLKMSEASGVKVSHVRKRLIKIKEHVLVYKKDHVALNPIRIKKETWDEEYNKVFLNFSIEDKRHIDSLASNHKSNSVNWLGLPWSIEV